MTTCYTLPDRMLTAIGTGTPPLHDVDRNSNADVPGLLTFLGEGQCASVLNLSGHFCPFLSCVLVLVPTPCVCAPILDRARVPGAGTARANGGVRCLDRPLDPRKDGTSMLAMDEHDPLRCHHYRALHLGDHSSRRTGTVQDG